MKRLLAPMAAAIAAAGIVLAGCTSAPAPAPTAAPAAPKPAEPTKAPAAPAPTTVPAAQPTAAPTAAPKVSWPEKGKPITVIVPWDAGSSNDLTSRLLAGELEKELGTPFQVVNKPGATTQIGMTELANAKPDGYTLGLNSLQTTISVYLDPERKAQFTRKSFQPVASLILDPFVLYVQGGSPYKTAKDLVEAAKAKPDTIKVGTNGVMSPSHMSWLLLEKAAGVKFATVHFSGGTPNVTALMGGHVEASSTTPGGMLGFIKDGKMNALAVFDKNPSPAMPGAPPITTLGYNAVMLRSSGWDAPASTPMPVVEILNGAIKKVLEKPDFQKKMTDQGMTPKFLGYKDYASLWDEAEKDVQAILDYVKAK